MLVRPSFIVAAIITVTVAFPPPVARAQDKSLLVFAAASMKDALDDVDAALTHASRIKVTASYDASSAMIKQIEAGASADLFFSADVDWMDYGSKHGLIKDDTRVNLLGNQLVLITSKTSKLSNVTIGPGFEFGKLAGSGRIVTGPCGPCRSASMPRRRLRSSAPGGQWNRN